MENAINEAVNWFNGNQDLLVNFAGNVVSALLILVIGNWVVKAIANAVANLMRKKEIDGAVVDFVHTFVRYLLFVVVLIAALGRIGVETASGVAMLGVAGLAVGLALQGSLSNVAAGVLIVAFRPFKSGDYVDAAGVAGSIDSIQIFSTALKTPDNKMIVVPNGAILSSPITNYSHHDTRRIDFVVGVSYSADLKRTKHVLTNTLAQESRLLSTPEPTIGVVELSESSVNLVVRPWVRTEDYWAVYFDLLQAIKEGLDKEGIEIPFPQMDVHLNKVVD